METFTRVTYFLAGIVLIYMGIAHSTEMYPYARGGFHVYPWVGWIEIVFGIILAGKFFPRNKKQ